MSILIQERLAVCSWSLRPRDAEHLLSQLDDIGLKRVQIALDPIREKQQGWSNFRQMSQARGITLVSGMFGTIGEDYTTMESIKKTGGVVPDATWPANWENIQATASLASELGLRLVTFHAGFLPHEESDPDFQKLLERIGNIADLFASHKIDLAFETGQETAETLQSFLKVLNKSNVGVNFDPANMILYDQGDPIEALRVLAPWLKQCHLKDAVKTKTPGTWGEEVPVGSGEVDWQAFFDVLSQVQFSGDLAFEREAGEQRIEDIRAGWRFIRSLFGK